MTYLEIIEWIEYCICSVIETTGTSTLISYFTQDGKIVEKWGKDLTSLVLEINGKELIK